ncbi:MAG TPA: sulfite exporter TauE/SafE family protein [Saprospiraceae bacterium]|nr:sulfite exporter TauE/SafE family protein [Saprospiraceae bacterium]
MEHWEIILFFFGIAVLYASIGFGGGSSYLAILALYDFDFLDIRSTALLCNIAVVTGSIILYLRNDLIRWNPLLPLIIVSVPMAFLGGLLPIQEFVFFILLASALCMSAILMWFQPQLHEHAVPRKLHPVVNGSIGGGIGFLSGIVGIGGGIFLSPLLHLIRWAQPKVIAATAAVFILVNSLAGLAGQFLHSDFSFEWRFVLPLLFAVIAGGRIGSWLGITYFSQIMVKRATALLVLYVSMRILHKYLFS